MELKTSYEDVFQVESSSVDEYLQQVHEMTVVTAIQVRRKSQSTRKGMQRVDCCRQTYCAGLLPRSGTHVQFFGAQEAQQESVAAFNSFMSECMESDWAACKRQFFDASVPERALTNAAGPSSGQLALVAPGTISLSQ